MFFDICDELKGKYPKDFKFTGWHPHCRCYATPILKTPEELQADNERIMQGEEPIEASENEVTEMPSNFNEWLGRNEERIVSAKSLPYFLRDNHELLNKVAVFDPYEEWNAFGRATRITNKQDERRYDDWVDKLWDSKDATSQIFLHKYKKKDWDTIVNEFLGKHMTNAEMEAFDGVEDGIEMFIRKNGKKMSVPVHQLRPTQGWVGEPWNYVPYNYSEQKNPIALIHIAGTDRYYVANGHHRAMRQILFGKKNVDAYVVDAPNSLMKKLSKPDKVDLAMNGVKKVETSALQERIEIANEQARLMGRLESLLAAKKNGMLPKKVASTLMYIDEQIHAKEFADAEMRIKRLEVAVKRHLERTPEKAKLIHKQWHKRGMIRRYGNRILKVMGGISDVDTSALQDALRRGNVAVIHTEAKKLHDIGKRISSLVKLDNPLQVARQTSMATAQQINDNITRTLQSMPTDLADRKAKLEFEINWMGSEGKRLYPATYQYAQAAYKKELTIVQRKIDIKTVADSVEGALVFATTTQSKILKDMASEMRTMLDSSRIDLDLLRIKASELNKKYQQLNPKPKLQHILPSQPIEKETLQELSTRLGTNMPPTLKNLATRIQKHISSGVYEGWTVQEVAEAERIIKEVLDNGCYGMNVPRVDREGNADVIDKIFSSWFKNQIETGTSKGAVNKALRKRASRTLFGTSIETAAVDYERYGFLMDRDILAQAKSITAGQYWSYGDGIQVRFKKDKVIATFTMDDSLDFHDKMRPSLCSDPKISSFMPDKKIATSSVNTKSAIDATRELTKYYIELQYHGKLTLDCVESVFIPKDVVPKLNDGVIDLIRKSGATIYSQNAMGELIQL